MIRKAFMFEEKVRAFIIEKELFKAGDCAVAGFSGGADSTALINFLHDNEKRLGIHLIAVHVNHGIRGEAARLDMDFTEDFCAEHGIAWRSFLVDVPAYAEKNGIGLEEAGRLLRYECLEKVKAEYACSRIVLAHHKNDQAETVLYHIIRGSGLTGIMGMRPLREDGVVRPFLCVGREDILAYCGALGLKYCTDATNEDQDITRNRIRLELIKNIEKQYNPNVVEALSRLAETAGEVSDYIRAQALEYYRRYAEKTDTGIRLKKAEFDSLPPALKRELIVILLREIWSGGKNGPESVHIYKIYEMSKNITGIYELPGGLLFENTQTELYIHIRESHKKEFPALSRKAIPLTVPSVTELGNRILIVSEADPEEPAVKSGAVAYLNGEQLGGGLTLRFREPGDRFVPFGMKGEKKLQDYFVDKKVPVTERDRVPLILCGSDLVFVAGYTINDRYKPVAGMKSLIKIELKVKDN